MSEIENWFKTYYAPLTAYAWKLVSDQESAKEIVQELFLSLYEKRAQLDIQHSPKAYLYQAVRNRCLNHLKKQQSKQDRELPLDQAAGAGYGFADPIEATEFEEQLYQWIEALPPACREVFRLSRFEGKSNAEIAEQLNLSKRTVETQISKALKQLRKQLTQTDRTSSRQLFLLVCVLLTISGVGEGCLKPIPYTGPDITPRLVINAAFSPDSSWRVQLASSQSMREFAPIRTVEDARLIVRSVGWERELQAEGNGIYSLDTLLPETGQSYAITAIADGFVSAFAQDTVPMAPVFELADTVTSEILGEEVLLIDLEVTDMDSQAFFFLEAHQLIWTSNGDSIRIPTQLYDLDLAIQNEGLGNDQGIFDRLFVDRSLADGSSPTGGDRFRLSCAVPHPFPSFRIRQTGEKTALFIRLLAVSQAYYTYQRSLEKYDQLSLNGLIPQPQEVVGNVQQGYGIFGAYVVREQSLIWE